MELEESASQRLDYWREPTEDEEQAIYAWYRKNFAIDLVDKGMEEETFDQCIVFEANKCPNVAYNEPVFVMLGQLEIRGPRAFTLMKDKDGSAVVVEAFV